MIHAHAAVSTFAYFCALITTTDACQRSLFISISISTSLSCMSKHIHPRPRSSSAFLVPNNDQEKKTLPLPHPPRTGHVSRSRGGGLRWVALVCQSS